MRKRDYGSGTVFQHGSQWYMKVRVNAKRKTIKIVDPKDGHTPGTKSEAVRLSSIILGQIAEGHEIIPPKSRKQRVKEGFKLKDAVELYLKNVASELSPDWRYNVALYLNNRIIKFYGENRLVQEIDAKSIDKFKAWLQGYGIENTTVNKILGTLSKLLKYCASIGEIEVIPHIRKMSIQEKEVGRLLSDQEIDRLFETAHNIGFYAEIFVALAVHCGLRHSEVCQLTWEQIDLDEGIIRLSKQKNKSADPAPLLGRAKELLTEISESLRKGNVILFKGKPVKDLRGTWKRILQDAGLDPTIRFHDLRHNFSSRVFDKLGFEGRRLTRHSSTQAFQMYLHSERKKLFKEAEAIFNTTKEQVVEK